MDAELKSKWVKALRSGKYEQGNSFFEHKGKFCCLGVLCKVAGRPTITDSGSGNWGWVDHEVLSDRISMRLATMNDCGGSFKEIADYIEANL